MLLILEHQSQQTTCFMIDLTQKHIQLYFIPVRSDPEFDPILVLLTARENLVNYDDATIYHNDNI